MNEAYERGRSGQPKRPQDSSISYYAGEDDWRRSRGMRLIGQGAPWPLWKALLFAIGPFVAIPAIFALAFLLFS